MRTYFKNGSWNGVCDVCGFRFKADQLVRRWDGAMVCHKDFEPRHPQDFIRVRDERISVPFSRPEVDVFVPQTTGVMIPEYISLVDNLVAVASFFRYIPNMGMYAEPLLPVSHALGLWKLNEETLGGTGRPTGMQDEAITMVEFLLTSISNLPSNNVINGFKLNETTLG